MIDVGRRRRGRPPITLRLGQIERVLGHHDRPGDRGADPEGARARSRSPRTTRSLTVPPAELAERPRARDRPDRGGRADPRLRAHPRRPGRPADQRPRGHARAGRGGRPRSPDRRRLRRGRDVQPGRRAARRPDPARSGRCRRCGSTTPAASARRPCGRAWSPACSPVRLHNESHGQFDAELFEIANVYLPRPGQALARRADPAGARHRPRFPGPQGDRRGPARAAARRRVRCVARPVEIALFAPGRAAELLAGRHPPGLPGRDRPGAARGIRAAGGVRGGGARVRCPIETGRAGGPASAAAAVPGRGPRPFAGRGTRFALGGTVPRRWSRPPARPWRRSSYLDTFQGGNIPDGPAERPFQHGLPTSGADADRRGSRAAPSRAVVEACEARFQAKLRT